jgi:hypothetical protein
MKKPLLAAAFVFQLCLPACANQEVMSDTSETQVTESKGKVEVVSVPEDFQNFIVSGDKICGMSTPSASLGDSGPSVGLSTGAASATLSEGGITANTENHGSWAYVADEVLFRLCEFGISYDLSKEEMLDYYIKTLTLLTQMTQSEVSAAEAAEANQ